MKATYVGRYFVNYDDGTCWPRVGTNLNWRARYDTATPPLLILAEVVGAFEALVRLPRKRRDEVIAAIRANASDESEGG